MNTHNLTLGESTKADLAGQAISVSENAIFKVCEYVCNCLLELEAQEKPTSESQKKGFKK